jgi:hypothetical protein
VLLVGFSAFMAVGALIVAHRPSNAIGWIFTAIGLLAATGPPAGEYTTYAYWTRSGSLPGAILVAWAMLGGAWYLTIALALVFTPLLFPTGRLLSPRWRPVAWLAGAATATFTVLAALKPDLDRAPGRVITNPIGVTWVGDPDKSPVGVALLSLMGVLMLVAFGSLVVRFRHSRGDERQQLKWITYAGALLPLAGLAYFLPESVGTVLFAVPVVFLPVAAGIAILRYRLYDIDRLINRTLVYGLLTALLAGVYSGVVLVVGQVFGGIGGDPPSWAVAGRPWPWRRCSSQPAAASRWSWTGGSTAASTTPPRRSRRSASACGTRSTWTRCQPSFDRGGPDDAADEGVAVASTIGPGFAPHSSLNESALAAAV